MTSARIKELELKYHRNTLSEADVSNLFTEIEKLRNALIFYTHGDGEHRHSSSCGACMEDFLGEIAREALSETDEK